MITCRHFSMLIQKMCRNLNAAQFQAPLNGFAEPAEEGAKHGFFYF